jgi:uncharacterized protein
MRVERPLWPLLVFARSPVAGQVKTRLVPALGVQGASDLHRQLIVRTLHRACAARGAQVQLWIAGDCGHGFVRACARRFRVPLFAQRGADLGQRMADAFARTLPLQPEARRCVLIGTDCPAQTVADLEHAAEALRSHDAVLQPAMDGGYVLIGLTRAQPALFESIAWGSPHVMEQTMRRAAVLGLVLHRLRALPDLDNEADLRQARAQGWVDP